jgi:hypothetical protein
LAKRFKGIVSVRHNRKRVIDWNISLRRVVSRCQPPGKKKRKILQVDRKPVKAPDRSQRHTAGFRGLRREKI